MPQSPQPQNPAQTGMGIAVMRAIEQQHADRLFDDPFAERFVTEGGPEVRQLMAMPVFVAVRTKFFDDNLLAAAADCTQVVLLGAGFDARAYRLAWPTGTTVFEVDLPQVLTFKQKILADAEPRCRRVEVPADLREDWTAPLLDGGFQPTRPTAWLAEGLFVYFDAEQTDQLVRQIDKLSAAGSHFVLGHQEQSTVDSRKSQSSLAESLYKSGMQEDPQQWLARYGWQARAQRAGDVASEYGRTLTAEISATWLMHATRAA